MLKCLIALTSLISAAVVAAPVWTWVDEQGVRHYSDRPVDGATQIQVAAPQTFEGRRPAVPPPAGAPQPGGNAADAGVGYTTFDIVSPGPQQTLSNIGAELTVEVVTYPALRAAHRIDVELDGERRSIGSRQLSFTLGDIFRGQHTLTALIVDAAGDVVRRSMPVTFFVQQASIQRPPPQRVPPALPPPPTRPPPPPRPPLSPPPGNN